MEHAQNDLLCMGKTTVIMTNFFPERGYMSLHTFCSQMNSKGLSFPPGLVWVFLKDISLGMNYIHMCGYNSCPKKYLSRRPRLIQEETRDPYCSSENRKYAETCILVLEKS